MTRIGAIIAICGLSAVQLAGAALPSAEEIRAYRGPLRVQAMLKPSIQGDPASMLQLSFRITNAGDHSVHGCLNGGGPLWGDHDPDAMLFIGPSVPWHCEDTFDLKTGESFRWKTHWLASGLPTAGLQVQPWLNVWNADCNAGPCEGERVPTSSIQVPPRK